MAEEQTTEEPAAVSQTDNLPAKKHPAPDGSRLERFKSWYTERKKWTIPASVLLVILLLAAIPVTRYNLAGLILKRDLTVKVLDATANTPVSGATVSVGSLSVQTDSSGKATLHHIKVGSHKVTLSKKYYQDKVIDVLAPILSQKSTPSAQLTATGRQVKITVTNLINKNPLADVDIKVAGTTAKTDKTGSATVVLPADTAEQKASLSADGFNDAAVIVKESNDKIQENGFNLTPAGKVYFLSKLSGKIDVVKTNLDGTGRQTVLAGTGNEDDRNTVLLASRDWKYLALLSKRAGGSSPSIYLIDTSNDNLSTVDQGNADFSLTGWVDDNFVYTVTRNDIQQWQPDRQAIKAFNAANNKLTVLDQTTASGTNDYDYVSQQVGDVYGYSGQVYYIMNWAGYGVPSLVSAKQATFNSVKTDGSAKKAIKSFGLSAGVLSGSVSVSQRIENPDKVHFQFYDGTKENFYVYATGQFKDDTSASTDTFYSVDYSTYLQSPSGNNTFWSEARDGKNTLFIGDQDGQNGKQIATLSDYNTYGWYTDNYLLVSKNSSELYIMDNNGKQAAVKISDYHKPAQVFAGYGGGYGGL